jgi:predicted SnoaL-like aldol condensation-catalyzing enzyme
MGLGLEGARRRDESGEDLRMPVKKPQARKDVAKAFLRLQEGTLVAVHSKVRHEPAGRDIAAVHLFRFKGTKIVELWDVAVEAPPDSPNEHGMF